MTSGPSPRMWSSSTGAGTGALCRLIAATLEPMRIRPGSDPDADAIAAIVIEADAAFGEFAPEGWTPPSYDAELTKARLALTSPTRRTFVAEIDGAVGGYASLELANRAMAE